MSVIDDLTAAVETYPKSNVHIHIEDPQFPGEVLNVDEEGTFKVRVTNNGPLNLTDVSVKITGLNSVQVSGSLAVQFSDEMEERLGDIDGDGGGVLVVRGDLLAGRVPTVPGGGTISYVHAGGQHYLDEGWVREEAGTPAIVESIRAGLVVGLKQRVGVGVIGQRESALVRRAIGSWRADPAIGLLGELDAPRLPMVSLVVRGSGGAVVASQLCGGVAQ
jgi:Aminotransferase class-V